MLGFFSRRQKTPVVEGKKFVVEVLKPIVEAPKPVVEIPKPVGNSKPVEETAEKMTSPLETPAGRIASFRGGLSVPVPMGRKHGKSQSAFVS